MMAFDLETFLSRAAYNAFTSLLIVWGILVLFYVAAPWNYHYTVKDAGQATWQVDAKEIKRFPWGEPHKTDVVTQGFVEQRQAFWNRIFLFTAGGAIPVILLEANWTKLWEIG